MACHGLRLRTPDSNSGVFNQQSVGSLYLQYENKQKQQLQKHKTSKMDKMTSKTKGQLAVKLYLLNIMLDLSSLQVPDYSRQAMHAQKG